MEMSDAECPFCGHDPSSDREDGHGMPCEDEEGMYGYLLQICSCPRCNFQWELMTTDFDFAELMTVAPAQLTSYELVMMAQVSQYLHGGYAWTPIMEELDSRNMVAPDNWTTVGMSTYWVSMT